MIILEVENLKGKNIKERETYYKINGKLTNERKNKRNTITTRNNILIIFTIIFINIIEILTKYNLYFNELKLSNITLKIKESGGQYVFGTHFNNQYYPDIIYINGEKKDKIENHYYLNQTNNIIILIWINNINNTENMFFECYQINEIDLSNFDNSKVTSISRMFEGCSSLTSINFSNFVTNQVTNAGMLFAGCYSLTSVNLSNFITSKFIYISYMFYLCSSLTSIDLSNFITTKVKDMSYMFVNCTSLTSIDLSNFNAQIVTNFGEMFSGCVNLEYINIKSFNKAKDVSIANFMFKNVPDNVVICLNVDNIPYKISSEIKQIKCLINDCSDNWKSNQSKIIKENGSCIDDCINSGEYRYEYNNKCYRNCPNGILYDNKCKCELEKCLICNAFALYKNICNECNKDYYPKENDPLNFGDYVNCYKDPLGYYFDNKDSKYKECYYRCKQCNQKGYDHIHNCLECKEEYNYQSMINNALNCYENIEEYSESINKNDFTNIMILTEKLKDSNMAKIDLNFDDIDFYNISNFINKTDEIQYYTLFLEIMDKYFTSDNYNFTKLIGPEDEMRTIKKLKITLTSLKNQNNNISTNKTTIDLGFCEILLKDFYNISYNDTLFLKIIEITQEGMKIPKVEFDIYSNLSGNYLEKLNLSICKNNEISLYIPVIIEDDSLDIYNSSSDYYNDICYPATSKSGTDIILNDRKNEFINENRTLCQEECKFVNYNYTSLKAQCLCKVKEFLHFDININKTKLLENFKNFKNI